MTETNPVVQAIASVMSEVGSVEKRGNNKFHGYDYATAADILHKLQPLMAKHGLVILQHQRVMNWIDNGSAMAIEYEFSLVHASGTVWPEKPVHTGVASAKNSKGGFDDKAANKCHTAARKYFLLALFEIPTGDYADPDADEDKPGSKQQRKPAEQKQPELTPPAEQRPAPARPFALITSDGEEITFERGGDYLKALEEEFGKAPDKDGFWESNKDHFTGWQTEYVQRSSMPAHTEKQKDSVAKSKAAAEEFCRVGKGIVDAVLQIKSFAA